MKVGRLVASLRCPLRRDVCMGGSVATARGEFKVRITPKGAPLTIEGVALGTSSISKDFEGALTGTSAGEMLTALTRVTGSAGYVAIERVTGLLDGRSGTFVLQHSGIMASGAPSLTVTIVPGSGTGELAGISGSMRILVEGTKHTYVLEYVLEP